MSEDTARVWLVNASLVISGLFMLFTVLSPIFGYPLEFTQALRLTEIVFPVFFGYLGSAVFFLIGQGKKTKVRPGSSTLLSTLVKGPIILFGLGGVAAFTAFGISNSANAPPGEGMSVDTLALIFTGLISLLAGTTSALVAHLFSVQQKKTALEND